MKQLVFVVETTRKSKSDDRYIIKYLVKGSNILDVLTKCIEGTFK